MEANEIAIKVVQHEEKINNMEKRLNKVEDISENLNRVSTNLEKLTMAVDNIVAAQKKQSEDIEALKLGPGNTAKEMWLNVAKVAITVVVTAIITALLVLIIKK